MPKDIENIGKRAPVTSHDSRREIPAPIKIAQSVLDGLEDERAEKLRKALPAYAMTLARQGKEVTAEILKDALAKGDDIVMGPRHVFNRAATPETIEQRYARIIKKVPENESIHLINKANISLEERMMRAAAQGDLSTVQEMIKKGTDIRAQNNSAMTWATQNGHVDVVKFLVQSGADVQSVDIFCLSMAIGNGSYNTVHFLTKNGAHIGKRSPFEQDKIDRAFKGIDNWITRTGHYPPIGLEDISPDIINTKYVETIAKLIELEGYGMHIANPYGYRAIRLFGTPERAMNYFEKWGKPGKQPLHDAMCMISLPNTAPDLKSWADAVIQQGPEMAKLVKFANRIPQPLKSADGKTYSLTKTQDETSKFAYQESGKNQELAALFNKHQMDENSFNDALALVKNYKAKAESKIPDITIAGESFGMPKTVFKKLPDGDYRGLVLGQITDCCQSIGGAGGDCAKHGFFSENGGFYVIAVNDNKKGEEIIGQSWAWRGKDDELVLDSLETLGKRVSSKQWADLTREFAKALAKTDIGALHIGKGGATPRNLPFETAQKPATPKDYDGYRDSHSQYKVR